MSPQSMKQIPDRPARERRQAPRRPDDERMKAWVIRRTGDPLDVLEFEHVRRPVVKRDELLISVEVAGVMYPDLLLVQGQYQIKLPLPSTPGSEVVGRVISAGPDALIGPGTRVMATITTAHGAFAECAVAHDAHAHPIPEHLIAEQAIALPTNYVTAHLALHRRAQLQASEVVVVHGGAGGVGSAAIELAKVQGARVLGVDVGADRARMCETIGADRGIDVQTEDVGAVVGECSGGHGADVVIDTVGGELFEAARRFIAFEGRLVTVGFTSGTIPSVKANQLIFRSFTVMGVNAMTTQSDRPDVHRAARAAVVDLLAKGAISPPVAGVYAMEDVPHVLDALAKRKIGGKAAISAGALIGNQSGRPGAIAT